MTHKFLYRGSRQEIENNIHWCRQKFGQRGHRWDFVGSYSSITLFFHRDQDATWYALSWPTQRLDHA